MGYNSTSQFTENVEPIHTTNLVDGGLGRLSRKTKSYLRSPENDSGARHISLNADIEAPMVKPMSTDLTDAKIAASEARTDAKFAELRGDMRAGFADIRTEVQGLLGKLDLVVNQTAQSDRQISDLRSEVRGIRDEVRSENHSTRATFIVTAVVTVVAIAAALVGLLQYGDGRFGLARSINELAEEKSRVQASRDEAQDATIQAINAKFDQILQRLPPAPQSDP